MGGLRYWASGRAAVLTETAWPASKNIGETIQADRLILQSFYTYLESQSNSELLLFSDNNSNLYLGTCTLSTHHPFNSYFTSDSLSTAIYYATDWLLGGRTNRDIQSLIPWISFYLGCGYDVNKIKWKNYTPSGKTNKIIVMNGRMLRKAIWMLAQAILIWRYLQKLGICNSFKPLLTWVWSKVLSL